MLQRVEIEGDADVRRGPIAGWSEVQLTLCREIAEGVENGRAALGEIGLMR
jgi:hypothetical protein